MSNKIIVAILALLALVSGGIYLLKRSTQVSGPSGNATSTPGGGNNSSAHRSLTLAGGELSLAYPEDEFGLAVNANQVLVRSYIPPCSEGFEYCLYYNGDAYKGTNFESAGLRINNRKDIAAERLCLNTPPPGFGASTKPSATSSAATYSASVFSPIGDAAAGHYAQGSLYRLFSRTSSACYELEARIGESQFQNYPAGSIREFTAAQRQTVQISLRNILDSLMLAGAPVTLPAAK